MDQHQIERKDTDLDPHQRDKLDPDPHHSDKLGPDPDPYQFADKPKYMEKGRIRALFSSFYAFIWKLESGSASK